MMELIETLRILLLERTDSGTFKVKGNIPGWCDMLFTEKPLKTGTVFSLKRLPFLEHFSREAEKFWTSSQEGSVKSGPWIETDHNGDHIPLEATAILSNGRKWLLVEPIEVAYQLQQSALQKARELRLAYERLEQLKNRLEESEALTRAILESAVDAIVSFTDRGIVERFNPAAEKIFGYEAKEILGKKVDLLTAEPDNLPPKDILGALLAAAKDLNLGTSTELTGLRKDGTTFPLEVSVGKVMFPGRPFYTAILRDITERKRVESQLEQARLSAESANRAKSDFIASVSHEIRTPLNAILGVSELLWETSLDEEQKKYVEIFRSSGENLFSLINDILDISKAEAGKIKLEQIEFNLGELLHSTEKVMRFPAREKGLSIDFNIADDVVENLIGDPGRLGQVLFNLLGNAIKFTERGGIEVQIARSDNDLADKCPRDHVELVFRVSDTGIGIEPGKQDAIFESFSQADTSTTRKFGGSGLGLAISKRLIELMHGSIRVESVPGKGSTFSFTVLFRTNAKPKTIPEKLPDMEAWKIPPMKILIVDDRMENRMLLNAFLKKLPVTVMMAENGLEAVSQFRKNKFDLVLMDMQMPVMDGYEATRKIRKWEKEKAIVQTPVVALTAFGLREDQVKSINAGCTVHLTKPIKKNRLLEIIHELVKNR